MALKYALRSVDNAVRRLASFILTVYQHIISPDHSALGRMRYPYGYCRFYPSCSAYAKKAFEEHTAIRAFMLTLSRLIRCNPWSKGGVDYSFLRKKT